MRQGVVRLKRFTVLLAASLLMSAVPSLSQVSIDKRLTRFVCTAIGPKARLPFGTVKDTLERMGVLVEDFFLYGDCHNMVESPEPDLELPPLQYAVVNSDVDDGRFILDLLKYLETKGISTGAGLNLARDVLNRVGKGRANHTALDALEIVNERENLPSTRQVLSLLREELCRRGGEYSKPGYTCPVFVMLDQELVAELSTFPKSNENWEWVVEPKFDRAWGFDEGLAPVRVGFKWGYVDASGNLVIRPAFDQVTSFSAGLAAVKLGRKWGFIDQDGKFVIEPKFDDASGFRDDGRAVIRVDGKAGVILRDGTYIVPPIYQAIGPTSDGRTEVFTETGVGFIDATTGRVVVKPVYDSVYGYTDGVGSVQRLEPNRIGYVDHEGSMITDLRFFPAGSFSEGLAPVVPVGQYNFGYIDKRGRYVVRPQFYFAGDFSEGRAAVAKDIGSGFGYIDMRGVLVVGYKFSDATAFSDGIARVEENLRWGAIDKNGNYIVEPIYEELGEFREGLAAAKINGRYGVVDQEGRVVVDFKYQRIYPFVDGYANVMKSGKWGVVDRHGRVIVEPIFEGDSGIWDGSLRPVEFHYKWGFIRLLEE